MPFTVSHAAFALLVRRTELPVAAVVIATMVPDTAVFFPDLVPYELTHSLVGIIGIDVPLAVIATLGWWWVGRPAFALVAPNRVQRRLPTAWYRTSKPRNAWAAWVWLVAAATLGAASHLVWDSFTHSGGWSVLQFPWLSETMFGRPLFKWAQYGSSALGVGALVLASILALRKVQPVEPPLRLPRWARVSVCSGMALIAIAGFVAAIGDATLLAVPVENALVGALILSGRGFVLLGFFTCVAIGAWSAASRSN